MHITISNNQVNQLDLLQSICQLIALKKYLMLLSQNTLKNGPVQQKYFISPVQHMTISLIILHQEEVQKPCMYVIINLMPSLVQIILFPKRKIFLIIGTSSQKISEYNSADLYKLYSTAMDHLAHGQIIQALLHTSLQKTSQNIMTMMQAYMDKSYYKTAALMAHSLQAVPMFLDRNSYQQERCFRVGQHFGLAFQIIDDILDYVSSVQEMGKQAMSDIQQGHLTAPVYFTLQQQQNSIQKIKHLKTKNKNKQEVQRIKKWVHSGAGIQLSYLLAIQHINTGLKILEELNCQNMSAWIYLAHKILIRHK